MSFSNENSELKFTSVFTPSMLIMLDGNKSNEAQTGLTIYNRLRDERDYGTLEGFKLKRELIESRRNLLSELEVLKDEARPGVGIILHLEFHGDKNGIEVGNYSERIEWRELMEILTEINIKTLCNLGLVLAGCDGIDSFKVIDMAAPVAFYFQLSHAGTIQTGPLQNSLLAFYDTIISARNVQAASEAAKPFQIKYAETIFSDLIYRICRYQSPADWKSNYVDDTLTTFLELDGIRETIEVAAARKAIKRQYCSYEKWVRSIIIMNLSFFCGRIPAYTVDQLTKWILDGKTLVEENKKNSH